MPGGVIVQDQELIIRSRVPRPFELPSHLYYSQLNSELTLFAHRRLARIQIFSACEKTDKEFLNEISAQLAIDFCRVGSQSYVRTFGMVPVPRNFQKHAELSRC